MDAHSRQTGGVTRGLDPRVHTMTRQPILLRLRSLHALMDCRVTALRAGPAMTAENGRDTSKPFDIRIPADAATRAHLPSINSCDFPRGLRASQQTVTRISYILSRMTVRMVAIRRNSLDIPHP